MQKEHKYKKEMIKPMAIASFGVMNDIEQDNPALYEKWDLLEDKAKARYYKVSTMMYDVYER